MRTQILYKINRSYENVLHLSFIKVPEMVPSYDGINMIFMCYSMTSFMIHL